jgi:hypothetical protein
MAGLLKFAHNNPMIGDYKSVTIEYINSLKQTAKEIEFEEEKEIVKNEVFVSNIDAPMFNFKPKTILKDGVEWLEKYKLI